MRKQLYAGIVSLALVLSAQAQHVWEGTFNNDWHEAGNWDPATVPTSSDNVTIGLANALVSISNAATAQTVLVSSSVGVGETAPTLSIGSDLLSTGSIGLDIGNGSGQQAVANHTAGRVDAGTDFYIGRNGATGTYTQSGGEVHVGRWLFVGRHSGGTGTYTLDDGELFVGSNLIIGREGSTSTFIQNGGAIETGSTFFLGRNSGTTGDFTMNAGTMQTDSHFHLGEATGTGTFEQAGGTNTVGGEFRIGWLSGSTGSYTLSDGQLDTEGFAFIGYMGGNGTMDMEGGTWNADNYVTVGRGHPEGTTGSTDNVFNHSGGTLNFTAETNRTFFIGRFEGTEGVYNFGGATAGDAPELSVGRIRVGIDLGVGTMNLSGHGTVTTTDSLEISARHIGGDGPGEGELHVTGGNLIINLGELQVGARGGDAAVVRATIDETGFSPINVSGRIELNERESSNDNAFFYLELGAGFNTSHIGTYTIMTGDEIVRQIGEDAYEAAFFANIANGHEWVITHNDVDYTVTAIYDHTEGDSSFAVSVIPEPSTFLLTALAGAALLASCARRCRR